MTCAAKNIINPKNIKQQNLKLGIFLNSIRQLADHIMNIRSVLTKFIHPSFSRDFKILCFYHLILALADGMLGLFLPIYLFESFNYSIVWVVVFYAIGFGLYGILSPLGAMWMDKIGLKKSIIIARLFAIPFYVCLYFFRDNPFLFAILANVALLLFRLFYWVPYHTSFVQFTDGRYRGRQMAYLAVLGYFMSIGAPLLAGFLLSQFSFKLLFILVIVIITVGIIPLFGLSNVKAKFEYSYWQSWKELFSKKNRRLQIAYMADGAENMVGCAIWPIFIYQILEKQYLAVGAITSLIVIVTIVCQLIMGEYVDRFPKKRLMKVGSVIYALGWFAKTFVATAFQIFIIGAFHDFAAIILRTPFDALSYEKFADRGSYIDEYTVLREMALGVGRILMGILLVFLVTSFSLKVAFPIAALVSLLVNLL